MKALSIVAAAILMTATGVAAAEGDDEAKKEKKVCKTEKITGSLTRVRRICMTQREWDQLAESTNRALDRMGRSANQAQGANAQNGIGSPAGQ